MSKRKCDIILALSQQTNVVCLMATNINKPFYLTIIKKILDHRAEARQQLILKVKQKQPTYKDSMYGQGIIL